MLSESLKINKNIVNIKRPKNLALSSSAKLPVLRHAINYYLNQGHDIPENIIDLQVTSPLRLDSDITKAYNVFVKQNNKFDNLISISKSLYHPSYNLVKITKNSKATLLDFNKTITGREMLLNNYQINGSIFIWKYSEIIKNENGLIRDNTYGFKTDAITSQDIDSEIDFIVSEAIYNSKLYKNFIKSS
jgi:CMP-N,N'-diacetyllegionaminic acid synthase